MTGMLAQFEGLSLRVPQCDKGIGSVILSPDSTNLIEGVRVQLLALWPDDRGYFLELQRGGQGIAAAFPPETTQTSAALTYPGGIKAFHYHLHQTDCWAVALGMMQVALVDLREHSRTYGNRNTLYVGALRPWQILIQPGVGHGYKVIGEQAAMLVYLTDRFYDPKDEGRIPFNDSRIQYDWETQHK